MLAEVMCLSSLSLQLLDKLPERRDEWLEHVRDAQRRVREAALPSEATHAYGAGTGGTD